MSLNVAQKLIQSHLVYGDMKLGEEIGLRIDQTLTQDATGTLVMLELEAIRRIDDFLYFRGNHFQHDFEPLPQRCLKGRASLAATTHLDEKLPLPDLHTGKLPFYPRHEVYL
jgi:hypothetical protein